MWLVISLTTGPFLTTRQIIFFSISSGLTDVGQSTNLGKSKSSIVGLKRRSSLKACDENRQYLVEKCFIILFVFWSPGSHGTGYSWV